MRDVGFGVGRRQGPHLAGFRLRVGFLADDAVVFRVLLQPRVNVPRKRCGLLPRRGASQRALRGYRRILALGQDTEKTAVAHYRDDAGNRSCLGVVDRVEPRKAVKGAYHASVEHPRQYHVLDEARSASDLVGEIEPRTGGADHPVTAGRERGGLLDIAVEQALVRAFPIGRASPARAHCPVLHLESADRHAKALGRTLEQQGPRMGARAPQCGAGILNRETARGHSFIGAEGSIRRDHANALKSYPEFLRGDLGERGQDPLPDFHFPAEHRNRAVAFHP